MENIVFTSVGGNTNWDELWLEENRNYDVWVVYYGDDDEYFNKIKDKVEFAEKRKGDKWQNLYYVWNKYIKELSNYKRIFSLDDDIIFKTEDINEMFEIHEQCGLWICQPSFDVEAGSRLGWRFNAHDPQCFLRYTNFVENNSPLMLRECLENFFKIYNPDELDPHGTDWIYMYANGVGIDKNLKRFAVIDKIKCVNPKSKIVNGKEVRECLNLNNLQTQIDRWRAFGKKHNMPEYLPKSMLEVPNKTQQIEHAKSNFSPLIDVKFDKTITFEKNENDKIAFLFLTRNNLKQPQLWYDFLSNGNGKCNLYVHTKERDKLTQQLLIDHQIQEHIHTEWGHSNLLTATNALIKEALKDKTNKRFILVSESCIPLHLFDIIYHILFTSPETKDKSFLYTKLTPGIDREKNIKHKDSAYLQVCRNGDPSKELGITWKNMMRNSQWMILNREHAEIADKHNHESLWERFNVADEWYYYNILRHYDPKIEENTIQNIKPTWFGIDSSRFKTIQDLQNYISNSDAHPHEYITLESILTQKDNHPSLFLRKVSQDVKIEYKDLEPNLEEQ
jgi:hypothetical protein